MTEYIKVGSDRPDFRTALTDQRGRPVDLTDATNVALLLWDPDANLLINDTAEVDVASEGIVEYDFSRDQTVAVGTNEVEIRVDWSNGDKQWFPITTRAFEVEIVRSPGDRDASLTDPSVVEDAEVNRLTVHDAIETNDGSDLSVVNGLTVGGDITVSGSISINAQQLGDGESIAYGTDGDFETTYDGTADRWKLTDLVNGHDALRVDRQGNLILPTGGLQTESDTVYDAVNGRIGTDLVDATSLDESITPTWTGQHTFAAGLETNGDVVDGVVTIYDAANQTIPASVVSSDGSSDGTITINTGKGIKGGDSLGFGESLTLNIEPGDFAGSGLQDDGSDNLQLTSGGVTSTHLSSGSVGSAEIQTDAVGADAIGADAVGESELDTSITPSWTGAHNFELTPTAKGEALPNVHEAPNCHLPLTTIPASETATQTVVLPAGDTLELWAWGVTDDTGATVSSAGLQLTDAAGTLLYGGGGNNPQYDSGSPLYGTQNTGTSPEVVNLEILNSGSSEITATAFFSYTVA